jgi:hypothetical protein
MFYCLPGRGLAAGAAACRFVTAFDLITVLSQHAKPLCLKGLARCVNVAVATAVSA